MDGTDDAQEFKGVVYPELTWEGRGGWGWWVMEVNRELLEVGCL